MGFYQYTLYKHIATIMPLLRSEVGIDVVTCDKVIKWVKREE